MKLAHNPYIRLTLAVSALTACISVPTASAVDLTWNNGASTGNWNTTEANWTGSTWSNDNPDNAVFNNRNETVTLTQPITAGSLSFLAGGWQSGTHLLTLTGSSLSLGSITVNGQNGGNVDSMTDAANQKLALNDISVTASGNVSVTRGTMEVSGATTLNITGKLLAVGDWTNFVMGSGTSVTVTGGLDFYNGQTATNLDFNGGTLTTAYIYGNKYSNAAADRNTNVNFNGTTVVAKAGNSDFLQVHKDGSAGTRDSASIRAGGLIFDTAGFAVTIANVLANYTGETGALTKIGAGTLTLSSANTYTGTTTVNGGTLALAGGSAIADTGAVSLADISGAGLQLNASETIGSLSGGGSSGGDVNLQANTLTVGDASATTYAGVISGSGSLTKIGAGNLTLSGANTYGGTTTVNAGTLTLSGARTVASGAIKVASVSGTNATLTIQNGTYTLGGNSFQVGDASNATGTVNQSGGAVSLSGGVGLLIGAPSGSKTGSVGIYNLSGGSISIANGGSLGLVLGVNSGPQSTFNLSGSGNLTVSSGRLQIGRSDYTSSNTSNLFNQTGGTASISTLTMGGSAGGSAGVASTLTLTGGTFSASAFSVLAAGNTNTAVINIGGTADVTLPALPTARGTSSTATLNFDGGTLRPFAASGNFIGGLTNAFIKAGGAKFDVASGKDITITQNLLTDAVSTGGGLTKAGVGALTLSGSNTYTGATTISAGTLSVSAAGNLGGASANNALIFDGGTLQVTGTTMTDFGSHTPTFTATKAVGFDISNAANTFTISQVLNQTTGGLTKAGAGSLILSAANTYSGDTTVNGGTLTLSGARSAASGAIVVAGVSGTNATLAIQNGTYALGSNNFQVGANTNATGTVNQSGGDVSFTGGTQLLIGAPGTGSAGVYNLSGGSISVANGHFNLGVVLGVNDGTQGGTFNLSGSGSLTVGSGSGLYIGRSDAVGTANNTTNLFNQTGGTASVSTLSMGGKAGGSTGVSSTLTLTGGTFSASAFSVLAAGNTNTAVINIGGTADVTLPALPTARGTSSTATLNFDGGTLRPAAASTSYISGLTNAFILDGGAKIDVASGKDITITQDLLTDVSSTGGGLTKDGVGMLTLSGTNTYTGTTDITSGTLKVSGSIATSDVTVNGGILASGSSGTVGKVVTVNSGGTLAAGGIGSVGAATVASDLNFSSGSIFDWDLTTGSGDGTYDTVSVTGSLNITSGAKFNVVSSTPFSDTFWNATHTWSGIFGGKTIDNFLVSNFLYSGSATAPGTEGSFSISGSTLTWTAVPEPTSALAGLLITAGLLRRRRQP